MPDRTRPHQSLQRPNHDQRDERDELEAEQIAGEAVTQEAVGSLAPIRDIVGGERQRHDSEHRRPWQCDCGI